MTSPTFCVAKRSRACFVDSVVTSQLRCHQHCARVAMLHAHWSNHGCSRNPVWVKASFGKSRDRPYQGLPDFPDSQARVGSGRGIRARAVTSQERCVERGSATDDAWEYVGIRSPLEEGGCGGQLREACSFVPGWSDEEVSCCTDEIHLCSATVTNYYVCLRTTSSRWRNCSLPSGETSDGEQADETESDADEDSSNNRQNKT